jgi:hypothetical protein
MRVKWIEVITKEEHVEIGLLGYSLSRHDNLEEATAPGPGIIRSEGREIA